MAWELINTDAFNASIPGASVAKFFLSTTQAAAADQDAFIAKEAGKTTENTVADILSQPPYPRNVTVKSSGTAGDIAAGDIVVHGTNINNEAITESFTLTADTAIDATGVKAFKTITKVVFPAMDGTGCKFDVGLGDKYGLPFMFKDTPLAYGSVDGNVETVNLTTDNDELEKNVFSFSSAPSGEAVKIVIFI